MRSLVQYSRSYPFTLKPSTALQNAFVETVHYFATCANILEAEMLYECDEAVGIMEYGDGSSCQTIKSGQ